MANLNETKIYGSLELDGPLLDSTGSAGSSGQILLSTGGTTKWVSVSGASAPNTQINTYCQFDGAGVSDLDPFLTTESELAWMNTTNRFTTNSASWTNNGTRITVPSNGFYLITVNLYYSCTAGRRPTIKNRLAIDGTGISDTCRHTYIRQAAEHKESTANFQSILRLDSGKQISILFQKDASAATSNNIELNPPKSSISIVKVKSYT
tara:strand:+ start:1175 stop:1798 length:624 start_codon:yes stop_codon:yes gene_type:complete